MLESNAPTLFISRNLPPLRGGMERVGLQLVRTLADMGQVKVIGPEGCRIHLPDEVDVIEVPARPLADFLWCSWREAGRFQRGSLNRVIAGSGLSARAALRAAERSKAPAVAYVHGLDLIVDNFIYKIVVRSALRSFDLAFANSRNTQDLAARIGVARGRVVVVHPGVHIPAHSPGSDQSFEQRFGLTGHRVLVSVGRLTERKGLAEFVDHALPAIVRAAPDVVLAVIGDSAPHALRRAHTSPKEALDRAIDQHRLQDHVRFLGPCDDETLTQAFYAANVHVFPVKELPGDVEGFGMVALEAAAHGTPTVAFASGGVPDAVAHKESGELIPPGDYTAFAEAIIRMLSQEKTCPGCLPFARQLTWNQFSTQVRSKLEQLNAPGSIGETEGSAKRGHAVLDLGSRAKKAQKIERLLGLPQTHGDGGETAKLLEVGCGSGGIAAYFAKQQHGAARFDVYGVDVEDQRQIFDGYAFLTMDNGKLPFPDEYFDVVISNHVIEHVGPDDNQLAHLQEIRRVLRSTGIVYLAVPNRWQLIEPHYRLAFLSWLPKSWRTPYLRLRKRGVEYDCFPPTRGEIATLFAECGFQWCQHHGSALKLTYELERPHAPIYRLVFKNVPDGVYGAFSYFFPTLIFSLRTQAPSADGNG